MSDKIEKPANIESAHQKLAALCKQAKVADGVVKKLRSEYSRLLVAAHTQAFLGFLWWKRRLKATAKKRLNQLCTEANLSADVTDKIIDLCTLHIEQAKIIWCVPIDPEELDTGDRVSQFFDN